MSEYFDPGRAAYTIVLCVDHKSTWLLTEKLNGLAEALESEKIFSFWNKMVNQIDKILVLTELTFKWRLQTN